MRDTPIHNEECERGVLGSILTADERDRPVIVQKCMDRLDRDSFYSPSNRLMYETLLDMYNTDKPIDLLLVGVHLKSEGLLDPVGGYVYLEGLIDDTPTSAHAQYYIEHVESAHRKRKIMMASTAAVEDCHDNKEVGEIVANLSCAITEIATPHMDDNPLSSHMDESEEIFHNAVNGVTAGLPLPWERFTQKTGGAQRGSVIPMIGRDGKGKSGAVAQILNHWEHKRIPSIYFSLEDVRRRTLLRMGGCRMGYSARTVETGHVTKDGRIEKVSDFQRQDIIKRMRGYKSIIDKAEEENRLFIYDDSYIVEEICSMISHHAAVHGVEGVVIDGFKDIMHSNGGDSETAKEKHIAKQLFKCAKKNKVAIIVVSHVHDVPDDVPLSKRNLMGSKVQFQGARQVLIFQDAGLPQITDKDTFVLTNAKSNYGFGGSVVLRRDENIFMYDEV